MAFSLLKRILAQPKLTRRDLVRREAQIGSQLFGPVGTDRRREFFCLDRDTWVWYEEWQENGASRSITTRYEVRPGGVLKVQDGQPYHFLQGTELRNLAQAVARYYQEVGRQIYNKAV